MSRKTKALEEISERHFRRLKRLKNLSTDNNFVQIEHTTVSPIPHALDERHAITYCDKNEIFHNDPLKLITEQLEGNTFYNPDDDMSALDQNEPIDTEITTISNDITASIVSNECETLSIADEPAVPSFRLQLISWALSCKTSHNSLTHLLSILRAHSCFKSLPKNAKSLLKTPRKTELRVVPPGQYYHFGMKPIIHNYLKHHTHKTTDHISLQIGIDGLPLSESSNNQLWPILCSIVPESEVFLVGCYFGTSKPKDPNLYLEDFIEEFKDLINSGFHDGDKIIKISLHSIVGDAPAKSFLTNTKGHSGYDSCSKCTIKGQYLQNRVCFPGTTFEKRKHPNMLQEIYSDYYKGYCKLTELPNFNLIENIPLDYMHLVCVGVVKKLIRLWLSGPLNVRLSAPVIDQISSSLRNFRKHIPAEFARRPRELSSVGQWKATESRQFVLYTGPFVLKKYLSPEIYKNFVTLHAALRILTSPNLFLEHIDYAEELLTDFVKSSELLYGKHFVVHNVHNLLHLADDVRKFGTLDSFSAFKYENYMRTLKKLVRKSDRPLQQLRNRYAELDICRIKV